MRARLALAVAGMLAMGFPGRLAAAPPGPEPALAAIDSLLARGDAGGALDALDRLEAGWGDDPLFGWQLRERRGVALYQAGRVPEALPLLEDAVRRRPLSAGAHRNLAAALAALGRTGRAVSESAQAVELAPRDPDIRIEYAHLLAGLGQWQAAAEAFAVGRHLCGGCPEAEQGLGAAYLALGDAARAVDPLLRAWRAAPSPATRRALVASLHGAQRDSMLVAFLANEDPEHWEPGDHLALVEAEGRLGQDAPWSRAYARELAEGRPAAAVAADHLFWGRVALNLLEAAAYAEGLVAADRAVALAPDNVVYRNNKVVLLLRLGRDEEAAREWKEVLRLDPSLEERRQP